MDITNQYTTQGLSFAARLLAGETLTVTRIISRRGTHQRGRRPLQCGDGGLSGHVRAGRNPTVVDSKSIQPNNLSVVGHEMTLLEQIYHCLRGISSNLL
ncbi:hypothetical protein [uncultured Oscillibacter sp.]|uniref:hypothetical protein n=1 Tax=uncultured Oscillibacter sp. TaxID=876091 RepID=UPI0025FC1D88|nr:hypothetical protein [uncultured Oscillibacter sp.]